MTVNLSKRIISAGYLCIVALFGLGAFGLIVLSGFQMWDALNPSAAIGLTERFNAILKCIAMLTIAMASFDLAETIVEEEFRREAHVSTPARSRRVLSRFLVVVVVSLAIESLVAVFQFVHDDPSMLVQAAAIAGGAALLLASWAFFLRVSEPAKS